MTSLEDFTDIIRRDEPLAPYTWLKLGGPAQFFITPRNRDELVAVVTCCAEHEIPVHILGSGSNLFIRDEGVSGAVIHIVGDGFSDVEVDGTTVRAECGALLSHVISCAVKAGLSGLENLAGIPGTIGGALRGNAGGRNGDIGQFVKRAVLLTPQGKVVRRSADELAFGYRDSSITELVILEAELELQRDDPDAITQRLRKIWITKKATQPLTSQSAGCIFRNPRGVSAGSLIEQAGLKGTRIGDAEISDRHANFIVTHENCTSGDVQRLIDLARSKVAEQFGVDLELEIRTW